MRRLLLARHGQSVSNAVRCFQGQLDVPLSDLGRQQARALGDVLCRRRPAAIYTSPMCRARETADIAGAAVGVAVTSVDDLRELSLGEWEGRTVDEVQALPGDPYARWVRDPVAGLPPGGEPLPDVQRRVLAAIEGIGAAHGDGGDVLVVCHGGVISVYLAHWLGLPLSAIWRVTVSNCSLSEVAPPRVLRVNDVAHLDRLGLTTGPLRSFSP